MTAIGLKGIVARNNSLEYNIEKDPNKKKVILLGSGWFSKGFIDHIDRKKFQITNISETISNNKTLAISKTNVQCPKIKYPHFDDVEYIDEHINEINLQTCTVATDKSMYDFSGNYLVCGLGSEKSQYSWNEDIEKILDNVPGKIDVIGAGITGTELSFMLSDIGFRVNLFDMIDPYELMNERIRIYIEKRQKGLLIDLKKHTKYEKSDGEQNNLMFNAINKNYNSLTRQWHINKYLSVDMHDNEGHVIQSFPRVFAGGDCVKLGNSDMQLNRTAQDAYAQGTYVAHHMNGYSLKQYYQKAKFRSIYVGNNESMIYHDSHNSYIIVPQFIIDWYHSL